MELWIEHTQPKPYAVEPFGSLMSGEDIVKAWMEFQNGNTGYGDTTFIVTPVVGECEPFEEGDLWLMRIDEIRSILIARAGLKEKKGI